MENNLENEIIEELKFHKVGFIRFVDISSLPVKQTRNHPRAVVFGLPLTPEYLQMVRKNPDYVANRVKDNFNFDDDEFYLKELEAGNISDKLAQLISGKGYRAYSQSDENQINTDGFDGITAETLLPHKTIAQMGGLGFMGKSNLLITSFFGSAQTLGTVLTDAPLTSIIHPPVPSRCGKCNICISVCDTKALKGTFWNPGMTRQQMIDVDRCTTCIRCLVNCPFTRSYADKK